MVKSRAIVKNCPKCDARVAVATKECKCGYSFFQTRRSMRIREAVEAEEVEAVEAERRRTSRVRREKPNYYDSQQFEKKKKKKETKSKRKAQSPDRSSNDKSKHDKESPAIRPKRKRVRKDEESEGIDLCARLPVDRQELAALILTELNRKMQTVVWTPQ